MIENTVTINCCICNKEIISKESYNQYIKRKVCSVKCRHAYFKKLYYESPVDRVKRVMDGVEKTESGCFEWKGFLDKDGYGRFVVQKKTYIVHRFVFEQQYGPIPKDKCVMHVCDNAKCINTEHLLLGSWADNRFDCVKKERQCRKLSPAHKDEIVKLYKIGKNTKYISSKFNVSMGIISEIGKTSGVGTRKRSPLTSTETLEIICLLKKKKTTKEIMQQFNVAPCTISHIACKNGMRRIKPRKCNAQTTA
jgi:transposase-like protein